MTVVLHLLPRLTPQPLEPCCRSCPAPSNGIKPPRSGCQLQQRAPPQAQTGRRGAGGLAARAGSHDMAPHGNDFDLARYRLAEIASVRQEPSTAFNAPPNWVILLKIPEINHAMAVYVGDFEGVALHRNMPLQNKHPAARPMTHDLMKNSLTALGARVAKVCITALVENTYHARMHYLLDGSSQEVVVDARPSDALNLAHRFGAPIYVNRAVADRMAHPISAFERAAEAVASAPAEVTRSCREALKRYHDPTVVHKVNMQVAIQENRFEDAAKIRNEIERLLSGDRTLSLVVAMESALEDKRWEEAAYLRNELTRLTDHQVPEGRLQDA